VGGGIGVRILAVFVSGTPAFRQRATAVRLASIPG